MGSRQAYGLSLVLALCVVAELVCVAPARAISKILTVPTARTIGAGRYEFSLDRKTPMLDESIRTLDLGAKVGLGERFQIDAKFPIRNNTSDVLFFGKYTFLLTHKQQTAAALGVENVGADHRTVTYLAISHWFGPVDATIGAAGGAESFIRFLAGADYVVNDRLQALADYNTGNKNSASVGFQYAFDPHWEVKSGIEILRTGGAESVVIVKYVNNYD